MTNSTTRTTIIGTHSGIFHADEVVACSIFRLAWGSGVTVVRSRDPAVLRTADVLVDVGLTHNGVDRFDHHQRGGVVVEGRQMASAGLVWNAYSFMAIRAHLEPYEGQPETYAKELAKITEEDVRRVHSMIDEKIMQGVDDVDLAGGRRFGPEEQEVPTVHLSHLVSSFNPPAAEPLTEETRARLSDVQFEAALSVATSFLSREITTAIWTVLEEKKLLELEIGEDGIVVLPEFTPWQGVFTEETHPQLRRVVFPALGGGYRVQQTPWAELLPAEWRGLEKGALRTLTGLEGVVFVHPNGFIGGADTLDDAMAMARA